MALIASAAATKWTQPRLFLSFWYDPVVAPSDLPAAYSQVAAANFTAVLGGFGALSAGAIEAQLSAADALGLGVVVATNFNTSRQLPISDYGGKHPSLWGYQIKDEPTVAQFGAVAAFSDQVAAAVPGKLRFNNLLPHAPLLQLNASSYDEYVQAFVDTVRPDVLSFDYYPSFQNDEWANPPSMSDYRSNLADMRRHALAAGVPFWNFFGVQHVFGGQPDPTEAQIRWQVFTSLAYGSKGLMYFCYWGGILQQRHEWQNPSSTKLVLTRHYAEAKRVNTDVLAWEALLLPAVSTGVWLVNASAPSLPASSAVATLNAVKSDQGPSGNFVLGQFTIPGPGRTLVMVVNQDPNFNVLANFTFRPSAPAYVCEVTRDHGQEVAVMFEGQEVFAASNRGVADTAVPLQLFVGAGDARLLAFSDVPCPYHYR